MGRRLPVHRGSQRPQQGGLRVYVLNVGDAFERDRLLVSSAAVIIGNAAFLAPLTLISPRRRRRPRTTRRPPREGVSSWPLSGAGAAPANRCMKPGATTCRATCHTFRLLAACRRNCGLLALCPVSLRRCKPEYIRAALVRGCASPPQPLSTMWGGEVRRSRAEVRRTTNDGRLTER